METIIRKRNLALGILVVLLSVFLLIRETIHMNAVEEDQSDENLIELKHVDTEKNDHYREFDDFINQLSQEEIDAAEEAERVRRENLRKEAEEKIKREEEERRAMVELEAYNNKTAHANRHVLTSEISVYTDLSPMRTVNADQMNEIIYHWTRGDSPFYNQGQTFIYASKESGLDPIYILAHAALESGWGRSSIATNKYNFFGIGAFDSNPNNAIELADNVTQGIINGAVWIARNYYDCGQTTLYSMRYNNGYHEYCTSETWMYDINNIIQASYSLLDY